MFIFQNNIIDITVVNIKNNVTAKSYLLGKTVSFKRLLLYFCFCF